MTAARGANPEASPSLPEGLGTGDEKARARARVGASINGKWRLDALLGVGGMASVYAATHRNGSKKALKILHPEFARDDGIRERFIRESYVANRIEHRGRVAIDDEDITEQGEPFLVMELLEGETAQQLWKRKSRKVPVAEALWIAAEVLDTLHSFHRKGIVHRDLKPANIFITKDGVVKILDFGVARMRDTTGDQTRSGTALGTPSFMAPEQAMGLSDGVDGRADIFSVGATLYALLSGERLHQGRTNNEAFILAATTPAPSLARVAPELPASVVRLVDKALAWDQRSRFESAAVMREDILGLLEKLGAPRPEPPREGEPLPRSVDPLRRRAEEAAAPIIEDMPTEDAEQPAPTMTPTAEGTLARTPFVHLLIYMLDQRLTGTTVFELSNGQSHLIYFWDGAPAKIRTATMVAPLDRVILERGLLDEATLRSTLLDISKRQILHGRHLVMKGLLDRDTVIDLLRAQLLRKVTHLFELPTETRYAYYEKQNFLATYAGGELTPCEPLAAIMAGIRARANDPLVDATLARIAAHPLALHVDADLDRFHLQRDELAVVGLIRARRPTLSEVIGAGVAQERVARLTIYALALTRHIDLGSGRTPVGIHRTWTGAVEMQPQPPAPKVEGPIVRPTTKLAQAELFSRQTTRMPRVAPSPEPPPVVVTEPRMPRVAPSPEPPPVAVAEPRTPPQGRPVSHATTKMPRVAISGDGIEMPDERPPSSRVPGPPSWIPPPSSARPPSVRPPPPSARAGTTKAYEWSTGGVPKQPVPNIVVPTPVEPAPRPDLAARRAEIERRAQTIEAEDHFQIVGVARDATSEQLRNAYFALARTWHPDRLPADLADLKPLVGRVFARINDAYQILSDAERRKEYVAERKQGAGAVEEEAKIARVVDAALELQKAEILLKKNDLVGAEALAVRAAEADPGQPEHLTLLAWIRALRRGDPPGMKEGMTSAHFDDLISVLDDVLTREPGYERALYYRGVLQKRAGRAEKAIRDFKAVADLNPKNLDAVREVRLYEMRRRTNPAQPPPEGGGLFGKFWKR